MIRSEEVPKRGRPVEGRERKVSIQVMVYPKVRDWFIRAAHVQNKSMSTYVNEFLNYIYETR